MSHHILWLLPALLVGIGFLWLRHRAGSARPEEKGDEVHRLYERSKTLQRLTLHIPGWSNAWIDTSLAPDRLGTRVVTYSVRSKVMLPRDEPQEQAMQRLRNVCLRFVPDPTRTHPGRHAQPEPGAEQFPILAPNEILQLQDKGGVRFPAEPGRVEIRLAGARDDDYGVLCAAFAVLIQDADDLMLADQPIIARIRLFLDSDDLPGSENLPNPDERIPRQVFWNSWRKTLNSGLPPKPK